MIVIINIVLYTSIRKSKLCVSIKTIDISAIHENEMKKTKNIYMLNT